MRIATGMGLVILGACCAAVITIGVFTTYPLPDGVTPVSLLLGSQGLIQVLISVATFVAGVITVILLFRRAAHDREQLEHTRETARITLFKDAAVLLSQPSDVANINGINMFGDLARAFPLNFLSHVANGLAAFVADRTRDTWIEHVETVRGDRASAEKPRTPLAIWNAYGAIGALRANRGMPWPPYIGGGRYEFGWAYLGKGNLRGCNFSYCDLRSLFLHNVVLVDVDFTETHAELFVSGEIEFRGCTFSHTSLAIRDLGDRLIGTQDFDARVLFVDCVVRVESHVGGVPIQPNMQFGGGAAATAGDPTG